MGLKSRVAGAAMAAGLVATSVGWYMSAASSHPEDFSSCHIEGDTLVLTYTYGVSMAVEPSFDTRGGDTVVSLRTRSGDGVHVAIGLIGEVRFTRFDGIGTVRYPDGRELTCTQRAQAG